MEIIVYVEGCKPPEHTVCNHHVCQTTTCRKVYAIFVYKLYCPEYKAPSKPQDFLSRDLSQFPSHSKMYELGDKYDVVEIRVCKEGKSES